MFLVIYLITLLYNPLIAFSHGCLVPAPIVALPTSEPYRGESFLKESAFSVSICVYCLRGNSHGQVLAFGILVCQEGFCDEGKSLKHILLEMTNCTQIWIAKFPESFCLHPDNWTCHFDLHWSLLFWACFFWSIDHLASYNNRMNPACKFAQGCIFPNLESLETTIKETH